MEENRESRESRIAAQSPGTRDENSANQRNKPTSKVSGGGWDFVYLKSDDNVVRLVELCDSDEPRSNVSTVIGVYGFSVSLCLAVPRVVLSPTASPVIVGNILELGDWNVNGAEKMFPINDLCAEGYSFFGATIYSNYSEEVDVKFRFALVVSEAQDGSESEGEEILCWEGRFVRRVSDCTKPGTLCLAFGRQDPITVLSELNDSTVNNDLQLLVPGWLSCRNRALLIVRLFGLKFFTSEDKLIEMLAASPVMIRLLIDSESPSLTSNFRGPLALGGAIVGIEDGLKKHVCFPVASGASFGAEFVQSVPINTDVQQKIAFKFVYDKNRPVNAVADLPPLTLHDASTAEYSSFMCDIYMLTTDEISIKKSIGCAQISLRCIRHCSLCPDLVLSSALDGSGQPPTVARPICVAPLPWKWPMNISIDNGSYFELPVKVSPDGKNLLILTKRTKNDNGIAVDLFRDTTTVSLSFSSLGLPTSDIGLVVRVFSSAASSGIDKFSSTDAVADIILSTFLSIDFTWLMIATSDLHLCIALCLKQMHLSVAFVVDSGVTVSSESLDTCRHYGVRVLVVSTQDASPALITNAVSHDLAIYTYCGVSKLDCPEEFKTSLEGYFAEGTFAEKHRH